MADFAKWAIACEGAAWRNGTFAAAFRLNREETVEAVLDADHVAVAVLELMMRTMRTMRTQSRTDGSAAIEWKGTATELLLALTTIARETMLRDAKWPKTANALSNRLRRATASLRERGVCVTKDREGNVRSRMIYIRLDNADDNPSASSASSATKADTSAQIEEAQSVDRQRVDPPVYEEGESVDIDQEGNVIETPLPESPAPSTNTADALISNAPKRYVVIKKPQKKVSEAEVPDRKTVDGDPPT
jgi:hypothetical protein